MTATAKDGDTDVKLEEIKVNPAAKAGDETATITFTKLDNNTAKDMEVLVTVELDGKETKAKEAFTVESKFVKELKELEIALEEKVIAGKTGHEYQNVVTGFDAMESNLKTSKAMDVVKGVEVELFDDEGNLLNKNTLNFDRYNKDADTLAALPGSRFLYYKEPRPAEGINYRGAWDTTGYANGYSREDSPDYNVEDGYPEEFVKATKAKMTITTLSGEKIVLEIK